MVADGRSPSRRSEKSRVAIITATSELLMEHGFDGLTIEAVAARAGVGKGTIYRWWPSRPALVADVLLDSSLFQLPVPVPDTGRLAHDVSQWAGHLASILTSARGLALLRVLTAASIDLDETAARLRTDLTDPLRDALAARLVTDPALDTTSARLVGDAIMGGIIFRILSGGEEYSPLEAQTMAKLVVGLIDAHHGHH